MCQPVRAPSLYSEEVLVSYGKGFWSNRVGDMVARALMHSIELFHMVI